MSSPRLIFHCDCNNFFASCECLERPELRLVPMAVAGNTESRKGVVVAKNELAKRRGIQTTDTVWQRKTTKRFSGCCQWEICSSSARPLRKS